MIRGTTPTHIFQIPFDTELLQDIKITYSQDNKILVNKSIAGCTLEADKITVKLTQEDTLKFDHKKIVELQIKAFTGGGEVLATPVLRLDIGKVLDEEVFK